jgi:predicted O-linked N-acetylglucosamine transferase (SPINDLY family)
VVWLPYSRANDDKSSITDRLPSRTECCLPQNAFVFCCFDNTFKINPQIFEIWMRLLVAETVLKAVGLSELITTSLEDSEALALRLARDRHCPAG